jgi:murein DD-endopeptidase MepM/ murein hydrolase activator NlpD
MHLRRVTRGLERGDRVDAGQQIGTLGASGVKAAAPHLHFALELPRGDRRGGHSNTRYADPAPFLVRATVRSAADRRRGTKPAI